MGNWVKQLAAAYRNLSKKQLIIFFLFVIYSIFLFSQYRLVGMYYDDFGNASLSYGYDAQIVGTNYTIKDLLQWAGYIYMNWGGRIIYALMLIPLLKTGSHLFMMIQVIIIILTLIVMYFIAKKIADETNGILIIISFALIYGLLQGDILTQGFYWASASVLYVWPMLPFMLTILLYGMIEKRIANDEKIRFRDYAGLMITIPLVTLSQEQLGGAMIVWFICNMFFNHYKNEKPYRKIDLLAICYSVATFGIFFAAPGNWARMATNEAYADKTFLQKIGSGFCNVLALLTNHNLKYFNLVLVIMGIFALYRLARCKKIWYVIISAILLVPFLAVDITQILRINIFSDEVRGASFFVFLLDMFFILWFYFLEKKQIGFMAMMVSGVASVFCLIVSPAFSLRSCIPYVFICMILCAVIINDSFVRMNTAIGKGIITVVLIILGAVCVGNSAGIYKGYESNYYIDNYNFNKLKNYNGTDDRIYLVDYENKTYRGTMSCDTGFEYIDYWMKEYFAIPQDVVIEWKSINELSEYAKMATMEIDYGVGFYEDEGGYRWADERAEIIINNYTKEEMKVVFSSQIFTGYKESARVSVVHNGEEINTVMTNQNGVSCEFEITLAPGENVLKLETDAQKIENGADARSLYMRFVSPKCEIKGEGALF